MKNNLGEEMEKEPTYIVRLKFEPAGRARGGPGDFYRGMKENKCVVCGRADDLLRKNVVPHEYRKLFPLVMKSKTSHDIVLLCLPCHQLSNMKDQTIRRKLEMEYSAPLKETFLPEEIEATIALKKDQRAARALLKEKNIPEWRKIELKESLMKSYPDQEISTDFLQFLMNKEKEHKLSSCTASHAEIVVDIFKENECLIELEQLWRQHFITSMKPAFLPDLWDINHNGNRLEIRASEGRVNAEDLKLAGVHAVIIPKKSNMPVAQSNVNKTANKVIDVDQNDAESSHESDWEYGSANSSAVIDNDQTLTEDDRYFSDLNSMQSFYETVRSDGSTLDDFQSFASSLTERPDFGSDLSQRSSFSIDSDTEIEDNLEKVQKKLDDSSKI